MESKNLEVFSEFYDALYLKMKRYEIEAKKVAELIREYEKKKSKTLLDVGCGTGEHLKYLSSDFQCTGIDINSRMIKAAKKKVPHVDFKVADMVDFNLEKKFDVIVSLFSSIGYVKTFQNLVKTLRNFHRHLNNEGLVMIEPWVFVKDFKEGSTYLDTYEDEEVKFVRMSRSELTESRWLVFMHYLIGKNKEIKYYEEIHEMLSADYHNYIEGFKQAGFKNLRYLEDLWDNSRGIFLAT
ncbi:MAG: class I SAM-dependent methyltransferase [Candidatus Bathyarchaeota archaeon]|jgi:ubiquinone/menaquinone biosynthesis C-methylase UbiE